MVDEAESCSSIPNSFVTGLLGNMMVSKFDFQGALSVPTEGQQHRSRLSSKRPAMPVEWSQEAARSKDRSCGPQVFR